MIPSARAGCSRIRRAALELDYPSAAGSLREGLEDPLTVMRLELPESLERALSSTKLIENLFSRVREITHRVKRWQGRRRSTAGSMTIEPLLKIKRQVGNQHPRMLHACWKRGIVSRQHQ